MRKLLTILLVLSIVFTTVPVSAANNGHTNSTDPKETIDYNSITGELQGEDKGTYSEYHYQAQELHYEISNAQGITVESGNLGDRVTSTPANIIDYYVNGDYISLPLFYTLTVYPEGTNGFSMLPGQMYFTHAEFSFSDTQGWLTMEADINGVNNMLESVDFNGAGGGIFFAQHKSNYRLKIMNLDLQGREAHIFRMGFVQYF